MTDDIKQQYGHKTRVRVCGICVKENRLLLVKHKGPGASSEFWAPPGGGVDYLENSRDALKREFKEETGLNIEVKNFLFVNEYIEEPLHALEVFFAVDVVDGDLQTGIDPEHKKDNQIIEQVKFVTFKEISVMNNEKLHNSLHNIENEESILKMRGYFHFSP